MPGFVREPDGALARTELPSNLFLTRDTDGAFLVNEGEPSSGSATDKMYIDPEQGLFLWWNKGKWEPIRVKSLPVDHLTAGLADVDLAAIQTLVNSQGFIDELFSKQAIISSEDGTVFIKDGVVHANHVVASEELSAKVGKFLSVSTDQLIAGSAKISGDLLADTLRGKRLIGGYLEVDDGYQRLVAGEEFAIYRSGTTETPLFVTGVHQDMGYAQTEWNDTDNGDETAISPGEIRLYGESSGWAIGAGSGTISVDWDDAGSANLSGYGLVVYGPSGAAGGSIGPDSGGRGLLLDGYNNSGIGAELTLGGVSGQEIMRCPVVYDYTVTGNANMTINSAGTFTRSTSLKRAKIDVQDQPANWGLLDVPYRSWIDKQAMVDTVLGRAPFPEHRVMGAVAEEMLEKAPELCTFDESTGELNGIAYDRMGAALLPLIRNLLNRVETLEGNEATEWSTSPTYDDTALLDEVTAYGQYEEEEPYGELSRTMGTTRPRRADRSEP